MTMRGFMGVAGSGKTTRLLEAVEQEVGSRPLTDGDRLLALTFMHGSRLRLVERLSSSSVRSVFECSTFDRFAWQLCSRWRSRLRTNGVQVLDGGTQADYDATCSAAALLLESQDVLGWVTARHPIVVVDEFQDCRVGRLSIVKHLAERCVVFAAADEFQDLSSTGDNPAVAWLRSSGRVEDLFTVHRTRAQGLLGAASALREGRPLTDGPGFRIISRPAAGPVASYISQMLAGLPRGGVAVLSPVQPRTSQFVSDVIRLLSTKRYGPRQVGPFPITWEETAESVEKSMIESLNIRSDDDAMVQASLLTETDRGPVGRWLARWVERKRRVRGLREFTREDVRSQLRRAAQNARLFSRTTPLRRAMTIHQAKNREFSTVIVLWPVQVRSDPESARRLLYNAITRAREEAFVFVQDGRGTRLQAAPFS